MQHVTDIPALPIRPTDAHKGTFGTVIVVAGSPMMPGAAALCATGALRGGVGLCKVAADGMTLPWILSAQPSATGIMYRQDAQPIQQADPTEQAVLAIGPGLGSHASMWDLIAPLVRGRRRLVLDADGLNLLAQSGVQLPGGTDRVLTPHPGEYARLARPMGIMLDPTDPASRTEAAGQLALAKRAVVVLKGPGTVVSDGMRCYVNPTGNPALATAGSGDVLTGLIAGLMAQGLGGFDAAVLGVYLHGWAADAWAQRHGTSGLLAMELAGELPAVMQALR